MCTDVVLYGSRTRGDADIGSDVDTWSCWAPRQQMQAARMNG